MLIFLFFALFFLILIESIYFLKKNAESATYFPENQDNQKSHHSILFVFFLLIFLMGIGSFFFWRNKSTLRTQIIPILSSIPTSNIYASPTLTENMLVTNILSPTDKPPAPTKIPTPSQKPTPTKKPTAPPKPTLTPKISKTPTPFPLSIGNPGEKIQNTITASPATNTKEVIIVPKLPIAGTIEQTVLFILSGLGIITLGVIL